MKKKHAADNGALANSKPKRSHLNFKDYAHKAGQMRFKLCCSKYAHLIPPNKRSKSRFLNVDTLSNWGMNALQAIQDNEISTQDSAQLLWIKGRESFIVEMDNIMSSVQEITTILKNEGLSKRTKSRFISLLSSCKNGKSKIFKEYMLNYLGEHTKQTATGKKNYCAARIL